jgi:hypothetical protein
MEYSVLEGLGFGLFTVVHVVPSHLRIVSPSPTAQPSIADTIATDKRKCAVGLLTALHVVPSHLRIVP